MIEDINFSLTEESIRYVAGVAEHLQLAAARVLSTRSGEERYSDEFNPVCFVDELPGNVEPPRRNSILISSQPICDGRRRIVRIPRASAEQFCQDLASAVVEGPEGVISGLMKKGGYTREEAITCFTEHGAMVLAAQITSGCKSYEDNCEIVSEALKIVRDGGI